MTGLSGSLVLDTHTAVWFLQRDERFVSKGQSRHKRSMAEGHPIHVPSICLVELVYLVEKGRIPATIIERFDEILQIGVSGFLVAPLDFRVAQAARSIRRDQVPDLPDRVIAATALALRLPLVTRDGKIRSSGIQTIW